MSKKYEKLEVAKIALWSCVTVLAITITIFIYSPTVNTYFGSPNSICSYKDLGTWLIGFLAPMNWLGIATIGLILYWCRLAYNNTKDMYPVVRHFGLLLVTILVLVTLAVIGANC